jgi:polysaccharide deacetylase 2 family uncharacterized protein YibQ
MKLKAFLISFFIILLILAVIYVKHSDWSPFSDKNDNQTRTTVSNAVVANPAQLETQLMERLRQLEVTPANIRRQAIKEDSAVEIRASIPRGRPMEWVVWMVTSNLNETGYAISDCYYESDEKGCKIQFNCKEPGNPVITIVLMRSSLYFSHTAKMAIFIEDFGFQADQTTVEYLSFTEPLTIGLIPEKKLTTWTAQIANEYHKEIIIMLPMEPVSAKYSKQSGAVVMVHYPEDKIQKIITESMELIPHFSGLTNYFGARVVDDSRVMSLLFSEINSKQAYFLYNPQSRSSSAESVAKKNNVPFKSVDVYIGNKSSVAALQDTLRRCAMFAQKTGDVIISSKPTTAFINALKNELPVLKQNGVRLVYISELMGESKEK